MIRKLFLILLIIPFLLNSIFASDINDVFIELPKDSLTGTVIVPSGMAEGESYYMLNSGGDPYAEEIIPWNIEKINTEDFWILSKGEGVKVAIVDTGIDYTHPDLENRVKGGVSFIDSDYMDYVGHGTGIAGIVAAEENDIGLIGIAPEADLYAVKVADEEGGWLSDVVQGLQWCIDNDMDIVVISLGDNDYNPALEQKVNELYSHGILLAGAAGNDGDDDPDDDVDYPARHESVIAVGATNADDQRVSYSSDGSSLELSAPGYNIVTTYLGQTYIDYYSGTSFSAPHVAGAAALLLSYNPSYTPDDIRQILREGSVDLGEEGKDNYYGYGRVDLDGVLYLVNEQTTTTTTTIETTTTIIPTTTTSTTTSTITTTTASTTTSSTTTTQLNTTTTTTSTTTTICIPRCLRWFRAQCLEWSSCDTTTTTTTIPQITTTSTTTSITTTTLCERRCSFWFRGQCLKWGECEGTTTTTSTTTTTASTTSLPQTTTTLPSTTTTTIPTTSCSGKNFLACVLSPDCRWIGDFRFGGYCVG